MVAEIRREKKSKKVNSKEYSHPQGLYSTKAIWIFQKLQYCMDNISSHSGNIMFTTIVYLLFNTLKNSFLHLVDNMVDLTNQRRPTVSMGIIWHLNVLVWNRLGTTTNIMSSLSSLFRSPTPLCVDHHLRSWVLIYTSISIREQIWRRGGIIDCWIFIGNKNLEN